MIHRLSPDFSSIVRSVYIKCTIQSLMKSFNYMKHIAYMHIFLKMVDSVTSAVLLCIDYAMRKSTDDSVMVL